MNAWQASQELAQVSQTSSQRSFEEKRRAHHQREARKALKAWCEEKLMDMAKPATRMYVAILFVMTCLLVAIVSYTLYSNYSELSNQHRILVNNNHALMNTNRNLEKLLKATGITP